MDRQSVAIKRFLIFAGEFHEKIGGVKNLKASVETIEEVPNVVLGGYNDWINILDSNTGVFMSLSGRNVSIKDFEVFRQDVKKHEERNKEDNDRGRIQGSSWN